MAEDNKVEVKFGAQTSEIEAGSKKATDAIKTATEQMKVSLNGVKDSVTSFHSDFNSALSSLSGTLTKFGGMLAGLAALMAGGALFKGAVDEFIKMNSEAKKLSTVMGTSIGDAQALIEAFRRVGVESDTVNRVMFVMVRQLKSNEEGFARNGIEVRDSSGKMLTMTEIMFNAINRLKEMEEGTERTKLATMLFGRSAQDMPGMLKMSEDAVDAMRTRLAEMGLTLDDISASKAKKFKEGMYDLELILRALKFQIADSVMPALMGMGKWMAGEGKIVVDVFRVTINGIGAAFNYLGQAISFTLGMLNRLKVAGTSIEGGGSGWGGDDRKLTRPDLTTKPSGQFVDKPEKGGGGGGGGGLAAQWQAELDQMKTSMVVFQNQGLELEKRFRAKMAALGREATKAEEEELKAQQKAAEMAALKEEQNFWKGKLASAEIGEKEYETVSHKIATMEQQINKARLQGEIDLIKSKMQANKDALKEREALIHHEAKLEEIDRQMKIANVAHMAKMGTISKKEEMRAYEALLKEKHAADLKEEQRILLGYKKGEKEWKEHLAKMELTAKGRLLETKKAEQATAEASAGLWGDIASGISGAFTGALSAMTQAGATFGSIMASIGQSILSLFISIIGKIVQEWLMGFIMTLIGAKTTDALKVLSMAGVSAAAGFASVMVALPFPANIAVAPMIAAAAFSETAAFAAAAGGWDVPADSMALLHKNEMVLPASLAENVRNMTGGGAANISINFAPKITHRMTQAEWHAESVKMLKAINRQLTRFGRAPLGPSYA